MAGMKAALNAVCARAYDITEASRVGDPARNVNPTYKTLTSPNPASRRMTSSCAGERIGNSLDLFPSCSSLARRSAGGGGKSGIARHPDVALTFAVAYGEMGSDTWCTRLHTATDLGCHGQTLVEWNEVGRSAACRCIEGHWPRIGNAGELLTFGPHVIPVV